jgi:hypothetical protein
MIGLKKEDPKPWPWPLIISNKYYIIIFIYYDIYYVHLHYVRVRRLTDLTVVILLVISV